MIKKESRKRTSKVAIVGAGFVGSTAAYALLIDGAVSEIALIDVNKEKAEGEAMDKIFLETKNAAYEVIAKKGATYYAIGLGISKIVSAILSDQNEVLALSSYLNNYHGVSDVCLSVPTIINRDGIKEQIRMPLNSLEKKQLRKSANIIKGILKGCVEC